MIDLIHGDCLEKMIDMILCDLPYNVTQNKWDILIPFEKLWEQYNRIIKDKSCIALFGSEPFSSYLRMSNIKMYKYDWVWYKKRATLFQHANKRPMNKYELISIFYKKAPTYNPIFLEGKPYKDNRVIRKINSGLLSGNKTSKISIPIDNKGTRYPYNVLENFYESKGVHPTQKPVALLEYLIKTYTNENETVLDNCMGSGSTGVACLNTNRNFIGIEKDDKYFKIAEERINNIKNQVSLF